MKLPAKAQAQPRVGARVEEHLPSMRILLGFSHTSSVGQAIRDLKYDCILAAALESHLEMTATDTISESFSGLSFLIFFCTCVLPTRLVPTFHRPSATLQSDRTQATERIYR